MAFKGHPVSLGTDTRYHLIKCNKNEPKKLLALRQFGCNSWGHRYLINIYETQTPYDYLVTKAEMHDNITDMFSIYPNPSNGQLRIVSDNDPEFEVKILSMEGRIIYTGNGANGLLSIQLREYTSTSGMYILDISSAENHTVKKLFYQNRP